MMEKITDKINALPDGSNYFSLEFFPPKTAMVRLPHHTRTRDSSVVDGGVVDDDDDDDCARWMLMMK